MGKQTKNQQFPRPYLRVAQPTLAQRIARLNPQERHEVQQIVRSLLLRKAIRRTLLQARTPQPKQQRGFHPVITRAGTP